MNALAVSVAVILFPGLIATIICDKIAVHSARWRSFKYSVYSFIFGVMCYAALQLICWIGQNAMNLVVGTSQEPIRLHVWSLVVSQQTDIHLWEVFWASLMAPVIAAIATVINSRKLLTRIAQRLRISQKFGDENLFSYYLTSNEIQWVYIRDPSVNQTYEGRVWAYSETDNIQEIVLSEATVYEYESSKKLYSLPTVYLARPTGTFAIEAISNQTQEQAQ